MNDLGISRKGTAHKRRRASEGHLTSTATLRRSCRISERRREQERGDDDTGDTESLVRKELELLSKEDLIEKVIRLKEIRNEFATLPDELVLSIFKYLPREDLAFATACTSRRWRRISYDPLLWKKVVITNRRSPDPVRSGILGLILARRCQSLTVQSFRKLERPLFTDRKPKKCYVLKELDLQTDVTPSELFSILSRCPELVRVETSGMEFGDEVCRQIVKLCPNVKQVRFDERSDRLTYEGFLTLFTGCPRLEDFGPYYVASMPIATYPSAELTAAQVQSLIEVLPPALRNISMFRGCPWLTDEHVVLLAGKVPNVTSLYLSKCPLLTAKSIDCIGRLTQLQLLEINCCPNIPCQAFSALLTSCASLRQLCVMETVSRREGAELRWQNYRVDVHYLRPEDEDSDYW